jgi:hypothetical protein
MLDYLVGLILIVSPWLFDFDEVRTATTVMIIFGAAAIVYGVITDYELGIFRILSFKSHIVIDVFHALLLAASPWIFGFAEQIFLPHLIFGLLEMVVISLTKVSNYVRV